MVIVDGTIFETFLATVSLVMVFARGCLLFCFGCRCAPSPNKWLFEAFRVISRYYSTILDYRFSYRFIMVDVAYDNLVISGKLA